MEVSASSEIELRLSSTRRNGASAPVFVFSSMHELYKTTLCLFSMEEHWMCFTASFPRYTVLLAAERHNMRSIGHGIFMHVHKKELYGFRTDESAADKKTTTKQALSDTTEP